MHPNFAPAARSHDAEETKASDDPTDVAGEEELEPLELREDYEAAVKRLVNCYDVIASLQEELTSKKDLVASLEEKIVRMSLELAKSKASDDAHRSRGRVSREDFVEDRSEEKQSRPRPPVIRAATMDDRSNNTQ